MVDKNPYLHRLYFFIGHEKDDTMLFTKSIQSDADLSVMPFSYDMSDSTFEAAGGNSVLQIPSVKNIFINSLRRPVEIVREDKAKDVPRNVYTFSDFRKFAEITRVSDPVLSPVPDVEVKEHCYCMRLSEGQSMSNLDGTIIPDMAFESKTAFHMIHYYSAQSKSIHMNFLYGHLAGLAFIPEKPYVQLTI